MPEQGSPELGNARNQVMDKLEKNNEQEETNSTTFNPFNCDPETQFIREDNGHCMDNPLLPVASFQYVVLDSRIDKECDTFLGTHYCGDASIVIAFKGTPTDQTLEEFAIAARADYGDTDSFFLWLYKHNDSNFFGDYREEGCQIYYKTLAETDENAPLNRRSC